MTTLARRRLVNLAAVLTVSALLLLIYVSYTLSLRDVSFLTGWLLLASIVALTLFNVRKKLPFLPLLRSALWLQAHLYLGLATVLVFALHVDLRVPNGWLEGLVALLFAVVVLSGLGGLLLSRTIPGRLRTRGELVLFERQPQHLRRLREELEALALRIESASLSRFYVDRLIWYFAGPRYLAWHLMQSHRPRQMLLDGLAGLDRYLDDDERQVKDEMVDLISTKDDLDYHYAHQSVLKYWLFLHIPLAYSLLILAGIHAVVAYRWLR